MRACVSERAHEWVAVPCTRLLAETADMNMDVQLDLCLQTPQSSGPVDPQHKGIKRGSAIFVLSLAWQNRAGQLSLDRHAPSDGSGSAALHCILHSLNLHRDRHCVIVASAPSGAAAVRGTSAWCRYCWL